MNPYPGLPYASWPRDHSGSTVMQPLPPTVIQEQWSSSGGHSYDGDVGPEKGGSCNFRPDVGLSDEALITMETKDLNEILKKNNISKQRSQEIKRERRTLKNRGYASNCRVKREEEQDALEEEIKTLRLEISRYNVPELLKAIEFYEQANKALENEFRQELDDEEDCSRATWKMTKAMMRKKAINLNPIKIEPHESIKVD